MAVPGISPQLFASVFITQAPTEASAPLKAVSSDDLFVAAMAHYLRGLHEAVIQSWQKFSEATQEAAQDNTHAHRSREVRHSQEEATRLAGQRRQVEEVQNAPRDKIFQGTHTGNHNRHLNLPA
ncbi:hypothetical protein ACFLR2_00445 [Chlamydiota bacterium]